MAFVQVTLFYVALFTGMRESELIGLSWDCVDWDHETIHLYRQLKRARGKGAPWVFTTLKNRQDRTFTVPHSVMAVLQKARRKQAEWKLSHGQLFQNTDNLVFTNELGEHLATHTVWKQFKQIVSQLGLPEVRFHDLRHPDVKQATKNNGWNQAGFGVRNTIVFLRRMDDRKASGIGVHFRKGILER